MWPPYNQHDITHHASAIPTLTILTYSILLFNWFNLPTNYTQPCTLYGPTFTLSTVKPVCVGHLCFQSKAPHVTQVANKWKPLGTMKTELCTITSAKVVFRVHNQLVYLDSKHSAKPCQWTGTWSIVMGQSPPRKFQSLVYTWGERTDDEGPQGSSTKNGDFGLCTAWRRRYTTIISSSYLLTYSMEQSPSWEANWSAGSQEVPRILWNPKTHHRTHKRTPPVPILS